MLFRSGMDALLVPSKVVKVNEIPKLGSGKTDFTALAELADAALGGAQPPPAQA